MSWIKSLDPQCSRWCRSRSRAGNGRTLSQTTGVSFRIRNSPPPSRTKIGKLPFSRSVLTRWARLSYHKQVSWWFSSDCVWCWLGKLGTEEHSPDFGGLLGRGSSSQSTVYQSCSADGSLATAKPQAEQTEISKKHWPGHEWKKWG